MGSYSDDFPGSLDWIDFPGSGFQYYRDDQPLIDVESVPPPPPPLEQSSQHNLASADADFSDSVLKYISQVLMEEDMEEKACMFHDALSLQAAEKSLYEALGQKYPDDDSQPQITTSLGGSSYASRVSTTTSDSQWSFDCLENNRTSSWLQTPIPNNFVFQSSSTRTTPQSVNAVLGSSFNGDLVFNMFNNTEMALQFKKGMEAASKFLPKSSQLVVDVGNCIPGLGSKEKDNFVPHRSAGKKSHWREDEHLSEERSKKQSAVCVDEADLSDLFDKILTFGSPKKQPLMIKSACSYGPKQN